MNEWYYKLDGETLGPISQEELLSLMDKGKLPMYTSVKNDGMETWREARSLNVLFPLEEQTKKLPVWDTLVKAFDLMVKKAPVLWNKLFAIALLLIVTNIIVLTQQDILGSREFLWGVMGINFVVGTMFVITIHRVVLLEQTNVSMAGTSWSGKEWKFVAYSLGFYFLISLTTILPMVLLFLGGHNLMMLILMNQVSIYFSMFLFILMIGYLSVRLSLLFPAIAVEEGKASFGWAMNLSSGNGWRLMILLFVAPLLIAYIIPKFYGISFMINVLLEMVKIVLSIFEITLLSVSFQYLSDFKEKDT